MSDYKCPKCGGLEYFMAKRNVSGVVFARLTTRTVPVCRKCDELMVSNLKLDLKMVFFWGVLAFSILIVIAIT